jgi:hypothetical protein
LIGLIAMSRTLDFQTENRRQAYMEWLYQRSGRRCCTYTGLYLQRQIELVDADFERFCSQPADF